MRRTTQWRHRHVLCKYSEVLIQYGMMTSSNGNIFCVTGHLCGEFTGPRWIPHTKARRGALMLSLICARINDWVNNREAGDLRRSRGHYDVIVMMDHFGQHPHKRQPIAPLIARFMGPTWGPSGADKTQVGPLLAPWTLLSESPVRERYGMDLWFQSLIHVMLLSFNVVYNITIFWTHVITAHDCVCALATESCHDGNFVINDGTTGYCYACSVASGRQHIWLDDNSQILVYRYSLKALIEDSIEWRFSICL